MAQSIAVLAEDGLLLEALLEAWQETEALQAYTPVLLSESGSGNSCLFRNRPIAFNDLAHCKQSDFALAIVLTADTDAKEWLSTLSCPVIGSAMALAGLEYSYCNDRKGGFLAVPQSPSLALQHMLGALKCTQASATLLMPAAYFGKPAVEELASQTVSLLNAQAAKTAVFQQQLSFNAFPFTDEAFAPVLAQEWQATLGIEHSHLQAIQVPVFHGMAMQLRLKLTSPTSLQQLKNQWEANDAIALVDVDGDCSIMNGVGLEGGIQLGCVKLVEESAQQLLAWLAFDDVQLFVHQGLIATAKSLLKNDEQ